MTKKILLIEDDQVMRENTIEILELAQYQVVSAVDGKEGSRLAREEKPDLILSDIMMTGLDGYGVLHVLSKNPKTADIPFIFLTAKAEKSELRRGMDLGADDYIVKPFEETELLRAVEARLMKSESRHNAFSLKAKNYTLASGSPQGKEELENLTQNRSFSKYKKKEIVFHAGDEPHYLYYLKKGKVKVYKTHDDGKEFITNIYNSGEYFGYSSIFSNKPYLNSALVLEESEVCKIPKNDFLSLVYKNRVVAEMFENLLSTQIQEQERLLMRFAYDTVRKRTAETLIKLSESSKVQGGELKIMATRDDLAAMAGIATETAIRCLGEFKEDQIIEVKGREIKITNLQRLKDIQ